MSDGNKLLSNVSSRYGAPMGRQTIDNNPEAKVCVFHVRMYDYCYDKGGAYWGMGTPLYAAIGDGFQTFTRAENRTDAIEYFTEKYPNLKFYRR